MILRKTPKPFKNDVCKQIFKKYKTNIETGTGQSGLDWMFSSKFQPKNNDAWSPSVVLIRSGHWTKPVSTFLPSHFILINLALLDAFIYRAQQLHSTPNSTSIHIYYFLPNFISLLFYFSIYRLYFWSFGFYFHFCSIAFHFSFSSQLRLSPFLSSFTSQFH